MFVKALKPFTRFLNGAFFSPSSGAVFETTSETGAEMISQGLVEEYTLITPTGTKTITANGTDIDVAQYAKADVAVPEPTGNIELTQNGTGIDIADYATATVAVPEPTGNIEITENGTNIDVAQYATASVAVPGPSGSLEISQDGTYDVSQYAQVVVSVGGGG